MSFWDRNGTNREAILQRLLAGDLCVLIEKKKSLWCFARKRLVKAKSTLTDLQNKYSGTVFLNYREMVKKSKKKSASSFWLYCIVQVIWIQGNLQKMMQRQIFSSDKRKQVWTIRLWTVNSVKLTIWIIFLDHLIQQQIEERKRGSFRERITKAEATTELSTL